MSDDFQAFVMDPRLGKAISAMQRSNDIFNIIEPNENQHSAILAWLFNPREGHGQGDAIFKDFLIAAYAGATENVHSNKEFFETWIPSRILATGFHSILAFREYVLPNKKRLDLVLVAMTNKILVVVENKFGARLDDTQIAGYYDEVSQAIRKRPIFKEFVTAHIVLDAYYGGDQEEEKNRSAPRNRWSFLDYQWLKAGAQRAELQLKRGNKSAGVVIAYCQIHSDYSSPEEKETDDLLADISKDYQQVISKLYEVVYLDVTELTPSAFLEETGQLWMFANHHADLVVRLHDTAKFSYIESRLRERNPGQTFDTDYGRRWFSIMNTKWYKFAKEAYGIWPLYIVVYETQTANKFVVAAHFRPHRVASGVVEALRVGLQKIFPELAKGRQAANYRRLGKSEVYSEDEITARVLKLHGEIEKVVDEIMA